MLTLAPRARYDLSVAPRLDAEPAEHQSVSRCSPAGTNVPPAPSPVADPNAQIAGGQFLHFAASRRGYARASYETEDRPPVFVLGETWGRPRR